MKNKIIASTFTLAAISALAVACAANTGTNESGDSPDEKVGHTDEALTSCEYDLPAASTTQYYQNWPDNNGTPGCSLAFGEPAFTATPPYGTSSCEVYVAEFQNTAAAGTGNPTGTFVAGMSVQGVSQTQCPAASAELDIYGFADATTGPIGWQLIKSLTSGGVWNGSACTFPGVSDTQFSDAVPNRSPSELTRYQSLMLDAQASVTQQNSKGTLVTTYFPVSGDLGQPGCIQH